MLVVLVANEETCSFTMSRIAAMSTVCPVVLEDEPEAANDATGGLSVVADVDDEIDDMLL